VAPLVLMAIVAAVLALQVERLSYAAAEVARSARVIAQANEVQKVILDQETGLRAFLLTSDRSFLQPYEEAHPSAAIDTLARLAADEPRQGTAVAALRVAYREWYAQATRAFADPASNGGVASLRDRKREMDAIRRLVDRIVDHEESRRAALAVAAAEETRLTAVSSVAVLAALGGTLAILTRRAIRQVASAYEDALARSAESEAALERIVEDEREAREKTQEALRTKDEFLSTLSHELRTPLTAILGWAGVLRVRQAPPETIARALSAIERNARVQAQIVDDILDVSRIVAGKFQLRLATTDLGAIVQSALDVVRFSAESKGVVIETRLEAAPLRMIGDPDRLQQVVWNLLSNAIKFTPRHGRVEVTVARVGSSVRLQVRDDGEGISAEFLPHVFERFRQADGSLKRAHGGLGLGLAIVKHLVDLHGGEVRAESSGPGRGALFTVTLPVGAADLSLAATPGVDGPAVSLRGVRVLVIDDDPDALSVLGEILLAHGAEVESATSGAEALAIVGRGSVDVIVSDIGMPELDGYELIQKIHSATPAPPALALTAYATAEDVERAHRAGFQRHLAKPVTPDHLVEAVAGLLRA
jgi:signal transduction histidine kinase